MTNKGKRFIVLLLSVLMVVSQMTVFSFAANETKGDQAKATAEQSQDEAVAFDQSKTVDGVKVTVKAEEGVFPAGSELSVEKVNVPKAVDTKDVAEAYAFDISILAKGKKIQPDGLAEVSFTTDEVREYDTEVFHMDGKVAEQLDVDESGKTASVEADGFSVYVITFSNKSDPEESTYTYSMEEGEYAYISKLFQDGDVNYWFTTLEGPGADLFVLDKTSTDADKLKITAVGPFDESSTSKKAYLVYRKWAQEGQTGEPVGTVYLTINSFDDKTDVKDPTAITGLVFDGTDKELINPGSTTIGHMEYKLDWETEWRTTIPVGNYAGDYLVGYRVIDGSVLKSGQVSVNIAQKPLTVTTAPVGQTITYTGSRKNLVTPGTASAGGKMMYSLDGETWSASIPDKAEVGKYTVYYKAVPDETQEGYTNYSDSEVGSVEAEVEKVKVVITEPIGQTVEYTGGPVFLLNSGGSVDLAGAKMVYAVTDAEATEAPEDPDAYKESGIKKTDAGDYKVWYKITLNGEDLDTDHYETVVGEGEEQNPITLPAYVESKIAKAVIVITPPKAEESLEYTGSEQALVTAGEAPEGYTFSYELKGKWTSGPSKGTDAGDYNVQYALVNSSNYEKPDYSLYSFVDEEGKEANPNTVVPVTIAQKAITVKAPKAIDGLVYDGEAKALAEAGSLDVADTVAVLKYGVSDNASTEPESYGVTLINKQARTDAGDYAVWYAVYRPGGSTKLFDNPNYKLVDEEGNDFENPSNIPASIAAKPVELKWKLNGGAEGYIYDYDGTKHGPKAAVITKDVVGEDSVKPVYDENYPNLQIDEGNYTAKVIGLDNPNYKLAKSAQTEQSFTITRKVDIEVEVADMTYGGSTPDPEVELAEGQPEVDLDGMDVDFFYASKDENPETPAADAEDTWKPWGPGRKTDAGKYWIMAIVTDPEGVYKFGPATNDFAIQQRQITVTTYDKSIVYGTKLTSKDFDFFVSGVDGKPGLVGGDTKDEVVKVTKYSAEGTTGKQPWDVNEDPGYEVVPKTVKVINPNYVLAEEGKFAGRLFIRPASENEVTLVVRDYTYGDDPKYPKAEADFGEPEIRYTPVSEYDPEYTEPEWTVWDEEHAPKDAGFYYVKAVVEETPNYAGGESDLEILEVFKRDATIEIKDGGKTYDGDVVELDENFADKYVKVTGVIEEDLDYFAFELKSNPTPIRDTDEYYVYADYDENKGVNKNYNIEAIDGIYTIDPAEITAKAKDATFTYDGEQHFIGKVKVKAKGEAADPDDSEYTVYYSDEELTAENFDTAGNTNKDLFTQKDAGRYPIFFYVDSRNYTPVAGSAILTINKGNVLVKVKDKDVVYGTLAQYDASTDVEFTVQVPEGEEAIPFDKSTIHGWSEFGLEIRDYQNEMSDAKDYTVLAKQTLNSKNYTFDYSPGTLTVNKKPVYFEWTTPNSWTYDGDYHGVEAEIPVDLLVGDDRQSGKVRIEYDNSDPYTTIEKDVNRNDNWEVINYTAKVKELRGPRAKNYTFKNEDEQPVASSVYEFRINPVGLTLTPNKASTVYGEDAVAAGYTADGLVNDEVAEDVVIGKPVYKFSKGDTEYKKGHNVGAYDIEIINDLNVKDDDALYAQNYTITAAKNEGGLTVTKRDVSFIWSKTDPFTYDGEEHSVEVVRVENVYKPDWDNKRVEVAYENASGTNAGTYNTTAKLVGTKADNYIVSNDMHEWHIEKAEATVTANNKAINYGAAAPAFDATWKGFLDGYKPAGLTFSTSYRQNDKAGAYPINVTAAADKNPNYDIKFVSGTLTVNPVETTLVAKATASGSKKAVVSWNSVTGAVAYDVYYAKCNAKGKKYTPKLVATVNGTSYTKKKLKKGTCYKFYVVAKRADGSVIDKSEVAHMAAGNVSGKKTNAKSLTLNAGYVSLSKGDRFQIVASQTKAKKGKKLLNHSHAPLLRFRTSNSAVAHVNEAGVITAVGSGYCKVYVQAVNGLWKEVEVNVK